MNENHARVCGGAEWAAFMQDELLPTLVGPLDLGRDLLEIGPGPGATTEWLRGRVDRLVALELESDAADLLSARFPDGNVEVVVGDASAMRFADESFDSVGCFTMLHHVPTAAAQKRLFAQVLRVLRPGGVLVGSDSLASDRLHHFHEGDVYNPIDPSTLLAWLRYLGFESVTITVDARVKFTARKAAEVAGAAETTAAAESKNQAGRI